MSTQNTALQVNLGESISTILNSVLPLLVLGGFFAIVLKMSPPSKAAAAGGRAGPVTSYAPGRFPAQDAELRKFRNYSIVQVHDDGDLTVSAGGFLWVFTTDGTVFREMELPK